MSIIGVVLGVMVLVIVQSVMNGFQYEIKQKIVQTQGDIRIDSDGIIYDSKDLLSELSKNNQVKAAAPYAMGIVMMQYENRQSFPFVKGIEQKKETTVLPIDNFIQLGDISNLDDDTIIISTELADSIGVHIGEHVDIYSPLMLQKLRDEEITLPKSLEVVGILNTGWHDVDHNTILISLELMQELYGLGNGVHGITVKVREGENIENVSRNLQNVLGGKYNVLTWQEMNRDLLFVLQMEKTMMFFVLIFILLVAAFSIASSLMTSVVRKTKEIGLMQALGAKPRETAFCFGLQGIIIGIIGSILGVASGIVCLTFRNSIIKLLTSIFDIDNMLLNFYYFAEMPVKYSAIDIIAIILFSIIICGLAGTIPALRVAKIKPAEALRNE